MQKFNSCEDWTFDKLQIALDKIEGIVDDELQLSTYKNQIEVISAEQMLDAYCITPDHKLLRNDLRWIQADDIHVGNVVLGFDEHGRHRKYRGATVTNKEYDDVEVFEVLLSSGKIFRVTGNHLWLTRINKGKACVLEWKATRDLRCIGNSSGYNPSYIPKVMNMWEEDQSKLAGWLAGIYDGEGNILRGGLGKLSIAQNEGPTLTKIQTAITHFGFDYGTHRKTSTKTCYGVDILGDVTTRLQFLGIVRPERLISNVDFNKLNTFYTCRQGQEEVVSVTSIGIQRIVKITTSTSTFICDGYPMHNSAVGMPIYYDHWQFGKQFVQETEAHKRGKMGLAYEIVINSNPCISYLMEDNTMAMQCLVMAHACFGHNAFFKNNQTFKQWTDASSIIDYLVFAKHYIRECEQRYGVGEVEKVLDAAHSLRLHGVDRYKRPVSLSTEKLKDKIRVRNEYEQSTYDDLWTTIPGRDNKQLNVDKPQKFPLEPEENLLYFIQKHAPNLPDWKREVIRIVRIIAQYFYPQRLTQVMNEGAATFTHYHVLNSMYDRGYVTDGFMLEVLESHSGVLTQRPGARFNPYTLGFKMYSDIKRVCLNPTAEDKKWFPDFAGDQDWVKHFKYAMENFKDESFILQYLSPTVMRDMSLFYILDDEKNPEMYVKAIHNDSGYRTVRQKLSENYNFNNENPNIQVINYDQWGSRQLELEYHTLKNRKLDQKETTKTLGHLVSLWGYSIKLVVLDDNKKEIQSFRINPTDIEV